GHGAGGRRQVPPLPRVPCPGAAARRARGDPPRLRRLARRGLALWDHRRRPPPRRRPGTGRAGGGAARAARPPDPPPPRAAARLSPFLGAIAGVPFLDAGDQALRAARADPVLMSDATHAAWEDWLAAECAAQPVLLVLEDLHWGDAATVRLCDATLRNLRDL